MDIYILIYINFYPLSEPFKLFRVVKTLFLVLRHVSKYFMNIWQLCL